MLAQHNLRAIRTPCNGPPDAVKIGSMARRSPTAQGLVAASDEQHAVVASDICHESTKKNNAVHSYVKTASTAVTCEK